jgi:foldase protein PrsA
MFAARSIKFISSAGLAIAAALTAVGCGDDVKIPAGAVAQVGDVAIGKSAFNQRLAIVAAYKLGRALPFPPSDTKACVRSKALLRPPEGQKLPTRAQLRESCQQDLAQLKGQTMQSLVLAQWLDQEAADKGVHVTRAEIRTELESTKKSSFGSTKAFEKFRRATKIPDSFFIEQARGAVLTRKLTERASNTAKPISSEEISSYFNEHRKEFAQPERRSIHVLVTKTRPRADQALQALKDDQSWKQVTRTYAADPTARASGGQLTELTRTGANAKLEQAVFKARVRVAEGPVKTGFGWFVFEVEKVTAAVKPTLTKGVRGTIRQQLMGPKRQKALDSYTQEFGARYQAKTTCADGFRINECRNGPRTKTTPEKTTEEKAPTDKPSHGGQSQN